MPTIEDTGLIENVSYYFGTPFLTQLYLNDKN